MDIYYYFLNILKKKLNKTYSEELSTESLNECVHFVSFP